MVTKLGFKLLFLTFVRSAELREATWSEVDFDKKEWRIPPERMKMNEEHIVPLSSQSLAIFKLNLPHITGQFVKTHFIHFLKHYWCLKIVS